MRTDPRAACANASERLGWAVLHDLLAHPLMALTNWAHWTLAFHDFTSARAWPRQPVPAPLKLGIAVEPSRYGWLHAREVSPGFWRVQHPNVDHSITIQAPGSTSACDKALAWFDSLASELEGPFECPATGGGT